MHIRAFLAAEVAADIGAQAKQVIAQLSDGTRDVKWVDPTSLHLTFKFFGETDPRDIYRISKTVQTVIASFDPFMINVQGVGAFPDLRRPRTIWAGIATGADELVQLQSALDKALLAEGFPCERRRFHPHVTLGRLRDGRGAGQLVDGLNAVRESVFGAMQLHELVLFSSELQRSGPIYTPLATIPLGRDAPES
ncbi:MAG: RNA 2',3'-cyclic phosphodiesterase [Pirellulaceae bacterium]|nr:RNA 2',3'-cyclic phosphodiesterase [Planctomycetales bacterium]